MLLKLFAIICSTSAVLSQYEADLAQPSLLPQFEEQNPVPSEFNESETIVAPLFKETTNTLCPANELLIQIKNILTKLLDTEDENTNDGGITIEDNQQDNGFLSRDSLNIEGIKNFVLPMTKRNTLRQLLENNNIKKNLKTKITVEYEVPNGHDVSCKQTLSSILQVLKNANLFHESSRSCGPYDINCPKENTLDMKNIGNQNVFTTNINQGNNNFPPNTPTSLNYQNSINSNNLLGSGQDLDSILKYLAWNKRNPDLESIFKNYRSKEQSILNDIKVSNEIPKSIEKLTQIFDTDTGNSELIQNNQTSSDTNTPYQLHLTENIVSPTNPNKINSQNLNISEILSGISVQSDISFDNPRSQVLDVDEKPDDVLVTVANDGKIISLYPSKNKLYEKNVASDKLYTDYVTKLQSKDSAANHVKNFLNEYLNGNVKYLPRNKINAMLAILKTSGSKSQHNQFPQETEIKGKYQNTKPYYINPNLLSSNIKPPMINTGTANSIRETPYGENLNDQLHANLNVFNQISNQGNLLPTLSTVYQTSYVTGNPYVVNSKLVDYGKHNQLHASYNLDNLQRLLGETNQVKLNSASDNSGVVELTYLLKRPNPVVYQPIYFVKYRLPYDSFVNNLRDLVRRQPELRSNRAKLYQELLALSEVAEVSPNLKGLGQQQLLHIVANNGALVKTKVLKVNETLLDKNLKAVQGLNSNLSPEEISNVTYTGEIYSNSKSDLSNNEPQENVLNNTKVKELEEFEKAKLTSSNFIGRDLFNPFETVTNNYSDIIIDNPTNTMYPLV